MIRRILVPLDGSPRAERAISVATRVAEATDGSVVLLRVIPPAIVYGAYTPDHVIQESFEASFAGASRYLIQVAQTYNQEGVKIETQVLAGPVALTILDFARAFLFDLVIINSRGHTGFTRWIPGSVAAEVAFSSPKPVLVLRDGLAQHVGVGAVANTTRPLHTLVTLDGSALAEKALLPAVQLSVALAASKSCMLHLLQVINLPLAGIKKKGQAQVEKDKQTREEAKQAAETYLSKLESRLHEDEWTKFTFSATSSVVFDSDIVAGIIAEIEKEQERKDAEAFGGYDLVAMTTRGRGDLQRVVSRSVTGDILKATKLPLLILREPGY